MTPSHDELIALVERLKAAEHGANNFQILREARYALEALLSLPPAREQGAVAIDPRALDALRNHQEQADEDGIMVKVSRQALDEVLRFVDTHPAPQGDEGAVAIDPEEGLLTSDEQRQAKLLFERADEIALEHNALSEETIEWMLALRAGAQALFHPAQVEDEADGCPACVTCGAPPDAWRFTPSTKREGG